MPKKRITEGRLIAAGVATSKAVVVAMGTALKTVGIPDDVVKCVYKGTVQEDEPLRCLTKLRYDWILRGEGFEVVVEHTLLAAKALHCPRGKCPRIPRQVKLPLLAACLPTAIAHRRHLPAMSKHADVMCHGLGVAKDFDGPLDKVIATVGRKRQEMLKCAHVTGDTFLCHPGGVLAFGGLAPVEVTSGEREPKLPRSGVVYRMQPVTHSEQLSKIMAVAQYRAQHLLAAHEQRQPDWAVARELFKMDPLTWEKPRNVFVFWSYKTAEGAWHAEVTEAPFKGLCA